MGKTMNGKSWLSLMSGIVTGVAVLVCVLALAIETMGCSAGVMKALMLRDSPPEYSGLPEEEYSEMCTMITGYLSGAQKEFGYELEGQQLFQAHEIAHMTDVLDLFVLDRTVVVVTAAVSAAGILSGLALKKRRVWLRGTLIGFGCLISFVLVLAVWGMADFPSLFVSFHRLFFRNQLWMLNPRTDLLIRLMPTVFFVHYGLVIAGTWGIVSAVCVFFAVLCFLRRNRIEK